jgi:hypothetical protein|tara:strand:- start:486 stop:638 length:153 start_codon:yes stop_codon:yes gene_type:complete
MARISPAHRREIAKGWNMKVSEVDWKFVEEINKKHLFPFRTTTRKKRRKK